MWNLLKRSLALGLTAALLNACGLTKDLKEMHDSTVNMNQTTTEMNANMKQLLDKMGDMATTTTDLSDKMTEMDKKMGALPEMNSTMKSMDTKMNPLVEMGKDMKTLASKMDTLAAKMDYLTTMNQSMQDLLAAIKLMAAQMKEMHGDIGGMREDMKTLVKRMDLLVTMNQSLVDVQKYIQSMDKKLEALPAMASDMKGVRGDMASLSADIKTLTGKMSLLETMNDNMCELLEQITLMRESMSVLKTMNDNMTGLRDDMKGMVEKMAYLKTMNDNMTKLYGEIKDMSKKMDALPEMKAAMDKMTEKMALLDKMNAVMKQMLSDLRLVFTAQHRAESLAAMEKATDQVAKMGYAAEYMDSQTYQSWHGLIDTPEYRLKLMGLAIPDFFFKMHEYIKDRSDVNLLNKDGNLQDLYAIAATLDFINMIELDGLEGTQEKPVSMNSMIEDGLSQRAALKTGQKTLADLNEHEVHVLEFEPDAIFLLRVRQNFLKGVVYTLLETDKDGNEPGFFKTMGQAIKTFPLVKGILKFFGAQAHIKSNLDTRNIAQAENLAQTLDKAAATQAFLLRNNIDPMNYETIGHLLGGIEKLKTQLSGTPEEFAHLERAIQAIVQLDQQTVH